MPRNKHAAKLVRRRRAGDLPQLLKMLWQALIEAEAVLRVSTDPELTLKACHAISQCGGQYARLLEATDLASRVQALEQALDKAQAHSQGKVRAA